MMIEMLKEAHVNAFIEDENYKGITSFTSLKIKMNLDLLQRRT